MDKSYLGIPCKKAKPTKKHRPAIWEMMLGTVYAMNSKREVKYFDYDYDGAREFAELGDDLRVYKMERNTSFNGTRQGTISKNKLVLWTN